MMSLHGVRQTVCFIYAVMISADSVTCAETLIEGLALCEILNKPVKVKGTLSLDALW